ncbi:S9 family peptidase [Candidatus Phycosocius spiralis]|uniref:Peptidase S9 n=1 Tax=Candidatus Phycosocius spiralis TaxID=2815099 RepID=A0ABQ4PVC3_9PROT|nr:S9 family peptidase [Candidatus Phycosocius spiralis]GIU66959.1 peptidase S9 [Candidatus Phycosocius spiralis]
MALTTHPTPISRQVQMRILAVAPFLMSAFLIGLAPSIAFAQSAASPNQTATPTSSASLNLDRLFEDPALNGPVPRAAKFSPDAKLVTWLRPNDQDFLRLDLWAAPVEGGKAFQLIDSKALVPDEGELSDVEKARRERQRMAGSRGLISYDWDQKGQAILAPLGGDIYYVSLDTPQIPRRLTQTPQFETDAQISPQGGYVSFIRDASLIVMNLANGQEKAVSPHGHEAITYGMAEFIAQEEMDRDTGYWWAPNDLKIVFAKVDETKVAIVQRLEIGASSTQIVDQRYPRAGAANAQVTLFIYDFKTDQSVPIDLGTDKDIYVARVDWSKDGGTLYVQRQNRSQTRLDLLMVNPSTGQSKVILTESDPNWISLTHDFTPLMSGDFLWTSERTGWRHIERRSRDGSRVEVLTAGKWPVNQISGVDEASGRVFFMSNKDDSLEQRLYSAPLHKLGKVTEITSAGGAWSVSMAKNAKAFLGTYSDPATPPRLGLFDTNGRLIRWIEENKLSPSHPWWPYLASRAGMRFGTLIGPSGDPLNWSMHLPAQFDASKKWPVIVYVYGGPGVQVVQRNWGSNTDQMQAARGYIVFRIDNRGTPNRGSSFERAISRKLGGPEIEDQLAGLAFLKTQPFIDQDRIGVWGWSYGGYMTLRLATEAPDAYNAYASGAPVTDWALYDTHYTERYMGTPQGDAEAYARSSVLPNLKNVKRPLLILHGMADDNVTFDHSTAAFDRLQAAAIPFEAMVYPGQKHGIREKARAKHVQLTIMNFFDRTLGPGPR